MRKHTRDEIAIDRLRNCVSALKDWEISVGYIRKNIQKSIKDYVQTIVDFENIPEEDLK